MLNVHSMIAGATWPAIPTARASQLLAVQFQLEQSQWLSAEEIRARQERQLWCLYQHSYECVPFYRTRMDAAGIPPVRMHGPDDWSRLPLLTREDIQEAGSQLFCTPRLAEHGMISQSLTSGSTGTPVLTLGTTVTRLLWSAMSLRQHLWAKRDFRGKLAAIRACDHPADGEYVTDNWGLGTLDIVDTGPALTLDIHTSVDTQADWLTRHDPDYLLTYPSAVLALAHHFRRSGQRLPRLREVRTFGEVLEPHVRRACRDVWGVPVTDTYSTQEVGYIALQCPDVEHYHVQSENVLMEVLDENGRQCEPGELGRVVITTLQNFAMPLLRYEIGDYAEVGLECPCGRGLPVLRRILGRKRNMFILPTGERRWPCMDTSVPGFDALTAVRQFQVVQRSVGELDVNLRVARPLTDEEESTVRNTLVSGLGYPFQINIRYVDAISRSPNGKFEDFRSDVDDPERVFVPY
ncbi:MAG: AMP-binding protein [Pirellulales bacterium]